jgi:hypothetical protein
MAQTFRINLAMSMSTLRGFVVSTVHMIAIVAHTFGIMLLVLVRAISDLGDFTSLADDNGLLKFVLLLMLALLHDLGFFCLAGYLLLNRKCLNLLHLGHLLGSLVILNEQLELMKFLRINLGGRLFFLAVLIRLFHHICRASFHRYGDHIIEFFDLQRLGHLNLRSLSYSKFIRN